MGPFSIDSNLKRCTGLQDANNLKQMLGNIKAKDKSVTAQIQEEADGRAMRVAEGGAILRALFPSRVAVAA